MAFDFRFPDVGEGIHEGELVEWLLKEGDVVKADQATAHVETDKAVVENPRAKVGDTIRVGEVLVTIGGAGEKLPVSAAAAPTPGAAKPVTLPAKPATPA